MTIPVDFGEWHSYSAAGKPSYFSMLNILSDSLGLIQNRGVCAVISSLSISNPQQVEEQRIIKMSWRKMLLPYWNTVTNQCILKLHAPHGRDHGKWLHVRNVSQMGFYVGEWMGLFTSSSGICRRKASVMSAICGQLNKNVS